MINNSENLNGLAEELSEVKEPKIILRPFFRLCAKNELEELGLRYKAYKLMRRKLPLDKILACFPNRADVVALVSMLIKS